MRFDLQLICAAILLQLSVSSVLAAELPPIPPSPVDEFRDWLRLSPAEREKALSDWPAEKREVLIQKLRAYEGLPVEQRERRLTMLELRWYLRPLMEMPPETRSSRLDMVPPRLQSVIQTRLRHWDRLSPETQRELLRKEDTRELITSYYAQVRRGTPEAEIRRALSAEKRQELEKALDVWNRTAISERRKAAAQIAHFFDLSREEQKRTLNHFPEKERQEIQSTLDAFARLSPEQRRECVNSFQKFARMSTEERSQFLRNAERWKEMTPQERETWKSLVRKLPPLPPDFHLTPPLPPGMSAPDTVARTNAL